LDGNGIKNLFFSLASESRLDILNELSLNELKMNEIARKINITPTEASRQIQRLIDELIIQKNINGAYTITNYGKLVIHFFPSLDFILRYRQYFLKHNVWELPSQFICRLGELSQATLFTEMADTVNKIEEMMQSSNDHVWTITDQIMAVHENTMREKISKGIKLRSIVHERLVQSSQVHAFGKNVERRVMTTVPGLFSITEKEGFFALLTTDGKLSSSGFFGNDPQFMRWVNDVFLFYWERTNNTYPRINTK
jgi:predicted transcriptional regulator